MPLKDIPETGLQSTNGDPVRKYKTGGVCRIVAPAPKYKLKPLVGYRNHCLSKYRMPSYSFGWARIVDNSTVTPGPKYTFPESQKSGYTFGYPRILDESRPTPGPKYKLRIPPRRPAYSIKFKTKQRPGQMTPVGYNLGSTLNGPAYTIGLSQTGQKYGGGPGAKDYINMEVIKTRAPRYSIAFGFSGVPPSRSPGPKYFPKLGEDNPKYSFGIRHSDCRSPFVLECDDKC